MPGAFTITSTQSPDQALFDELQARVYLEPGRWLATLEELVATCRRLNEPRFPDPRPQPRSRGE